MTRSSSSNRKNYSIAAALVPVFAVILLDRYVKHLIRAEFSVGESVAVIEGVFHITYVRNTGAAFSMFRDMPLMTVALPSAVVLVCAVVLFRLCVQGNSFAAFAAALILAGGTGNLIDRFTLGYVVDMFDFRVFPVFNIADIAVTCGCFLFFVWAVFIDGRQEDR